MPTKVELSLIFQKRLKQLARKYPSVVSEVRELIQQLEKDERLGDKLQDVGYDVYKIRLKNPSARKGKSGGFRVIYYVKMKDNLILVTIYSKSEQKDISLDSLRKILEEIAAENKD